MKPSSEPGSVPQWLVDRAARRISTGTLVCSYCPTRLEPGMDSIIRFEHLPGLVFCDRCADAAARNHPVPIRHRAAPKVDRQRLTVHVAIQAALVLLSTAAVLAIIAWASTARP